MDMQLEPYQMEQAWIEAASGLAEELSERQLVGSFSLPPGLIDARPFSWAGFQTFTRYTYISPLPLELAPARSTAKTIRRAERDGLMVERTDNPAEVIQCLNSTSSRKRFDYRLNEGALNELATVLGGNQCQMHIVRTKDGDSVSAGVRLVPASGTALGWVQGTTPMGLRVGAPQLMQREVAEDAYTQGATHYDYGGANIQSVARAKSVWNFRLVPYIEVRSFDGRALYRSSRGFIDHLSKSVVRNIAPGSAPMSTGKRKD